MDIISLLVLLVVVGLVLWLVTTYVPMPQPIKTVVVAIAVLIFCVFLLNWAGIGHMHLGSPR